MKKNFGMVGRQEKNNFKVNGSLGRERDKKKHELKYLDRAERNLEYY